MSRPVALASPVVLEAFAATVSYRLELRALPAERMVWSLADLRVGDVAGERVNRAAASCHDFFVTGDGCPLVEALQQLARAPKRSGQALELDTLAAWARRHGLLTLAFWLALLGALIAVTGR